MESSPDIWEDLRKQARLLENEIDVKLLSFSRLGAGYGSLQPQSDSVPLLNGSRNERMFETMVLEIEQLLAKLTELNDQMAPFGSTPANSTLTPNLKMMTHTVQRHQDILKDYSVEFRKVRANIQAKRDKEELLGSVRKDIDTFKGNSGLNRRTELYLKEHEHIRSSDKLVDEQIKIAMKTKDDLRMQRSTLKAIQTQMTTLANRFPAVSSLIQRINFRKRRDSIIVGAVIGVCVLFLLLYTLH